MKHLQLYENYQPGEFEWLAGSPDVGLHIMQRHGDDKLWVLDVDMLNNHYPEFWEQYLERGDRGGEFFPEDDSQCEAVSDDLYNGKVPWNMRGKELIWDGDSAREFVDRFKNHGDVTLLRIPDAEAAEWLINKISDAQRIPYDRAAIKGISSVLYHNYLQG